MVHRVRLSCCGPYAFILYSIRYPWASVGTRVRWWEFLCNTGVLRGGSVVHRRMPMVERWITCTHVTVMEWFVWVLVQWFSDVTGQKNSQNRFQISCKLCSNPAWNSKVMLVWVCMWCKKHGNPLEFIMTITTKSVTFNFFHSFAIQFAMLKFWFCSNW